MRIVLALTVQVPGEPPRFFDYVSEGSRAPAVGEEVVIAVHPGVTKGSDPITAKVTAVTWTDLRFDEVRVSLSAKEPQVSKETLIDGPAWQD